MSEPIRKPKQIPESYTPKNKPEIIKMVENAPFPTERLVETFTCNGVAFEIVERPEVLWVGCLDYVNSNGSEPDSDLLLARYQKYLWLQSSSNYEPNGAIPGDFEIYMNMTDITSESKAEILIPIQPKGKNN
jgi:hypothetical protein